MGAIIGLEKRTSRRLELFVRLLEPVMLVTAVVTLIIVAGCCFRCSRCPTSSGE